MVSVSSHLDRKASKTQLARKWGSSWERPPSAWQQAPRRHGSVMAQRDNLQHQSAGDGRIGVQGSTGTLGREKSHRQRQRWAPGTDTATAEYKPSAEVAALQDVLQRAHMMNMSMLRRGADQAQAAPAATCDTLNDFTASGVAPPHDLPRTAWAQSTGERAPEHTSTPFSPSTRPGPGPEMGNVWPQAWHHRYVPCHAALSIPSITLHHGTLVACMSRYQHAARVVFFAHAHTAAGVEQESATTITK